MIVDAAIIAVFFVVYLGMILGGLPFLQLDRTGIALLGAIALVSVGALSLEEAWGAIHAPTLILLFAFMVISAQLRLGGFYAWVTYRLGGLPLPPAGLLAVLILAIAVLSAVFSNDIICLAVAPVLVEVCLARRLNPVPFLLALACSANVGSAATLIGNPAEHADRRDAAAAVRELPARGGDPGGARPRRHLGADRLADARPVGDGARRRRARGRTSGRRSSAALRPLAEREGSDGVDDSSSCCSCSRRCRAKWWRWWRRACS